MAICEKDQNHDRFQFGAGIKRVTAGPGGEAILIMGSEKTALLDCGMAYCGEALIKNIKSHLGERPLDYVILSHTHYDHIGGLPYLKEAWPASAAVGSSHAKRVFERQSALKTIRRLSIAAGEVYCKSEQLADYGLRPEDIRVSYEDSNIRVDRVVKEGDLIDLGNIHLRVIETPGHTDCSISFFLEEKRILFASETLGCLTPDGEIMMAMLKGYHNTALSIEKGKRLKPDFIIAPHYGKVPELLTLNYWERAKETADGYRDFILNTYFAGASEGEIYDAYQKEYWHDITRNQQPLEAFEINGKQIIRAVLSEMASPVR